MNDRRLLNGLLGANYADRQRAVTVLCEIQLVDREVGKLRT